MALRISDARLDQLVAEDVPYVDLTTEILGIAGKPGRMSYYTREAGVLCGTEEAGRIARSLGLEVVSALPSGSRIEPGQVFMVVEGPSEGLHMAWKVCLNIFDHFSAVATRTREVVDAAKSANPRIEVLTTRKSMPGAKDLLTKAVMAGGAYPHRLGLSETLLVFEQHITFMGGFDALVEALPDIRSHCVEKKLFVEATAEQALVLARAGVDGIQLDKVPVDQVAELLAELRAIDARLTVCAAGGINAANAAAYAATGLDGLVTTWPFSAKPLDMSARMECL